VLSVFVLSVFVLPVFVLPVSVEVAVAPVVPVGVATVEPVLLDAPAVPAGLVARTTPVAGRPDTVVTSLPTKMRSLAFSDAVNVDPPAIEITRWFLEYVPLAGVVTPSRLTAAVSVPLLALVAEVEAILSETLSFAVEEACLGPLLAFSDIVAE
jgi:hypothetical protein